MPARSRTQQAANPSPADPIATLRERTRELEREWRELPQRRNAVLLSGNEQEIVRLMIRERQLPLEWLDTLRQRVASCRASLEAEQQQLLREREELRQQLLPRYTELLATFEEFATLQRRYAELLLPDGSEQELKFLVLSRHAYAAVQTEAQPLQSVRNLLHSLNDCGLWLDRVHAALTEGSSEALQLVGSLLSGEPCLQVRVLESIEESIERKRNAKGSSKG